MTTFTFFAVVSRVFDTGHVKAQIIDIKAKEQPKDVYKEGSFCNYYCDWFASLADANAHLKELTKDNQF